MGDYNHETSDVEETEMVTDEVREIPHVPVPQQLSVALGMLALIFGASYIDDLNAALQSPAANEAPAQSEAQLPAAGKQQKNVDYFDNVDIAATSAYVWDVRAQRALYKKNADEQLPLASLTKLMTALVAHELIAAGQQITIPTDAILQSGDSGLSDGELFDIQNLTDLTLVTSSNDGAYALATAAGAALTDRDNPAPTFVAAMNIRAEEIGLTQTSFKNPTGLDISEEKAGASGSARDMAFLMEYIIEHYPELLEITREDLLTIPNINGERHLAENTNEFVSDIQGIIASKTGYTELAGGNLIIAFDAGLNRPIIIAVLGSTRDDRFDDTLELVERTKQHVTHNH